MEQPKDYHEVEQMTQRAFRNKHQQGCDEHYLVHKLRMDEAYLPGISRVALIDGKVGGWIMYSKAYVTDGDKKHDIITFGPQYHYIGTSIF